MIHRREGASYEEGGSRRHAARSVRIPGGAMLTVVRFVSKMTAPVLVFASLIIGTMPPTKGAPPVQAQQPTGEPFRIEEATIGGIHAAIMRRELTATDLVQAYLARIKAYNGV